MARSRRSQFLILIASIIICQLAGVVGSIFTTPAIPTWYAGLNRPSLTPPNWLFAPVWTFLFLLMGISLFLVWRKSQPTARRRLALSIFAIQLVLNVLWSLVFFGLRSPLGGLIVIGLLWVAILLTIVSFWKISKTASVLLLPYILWVSFAAILNSYLWKLNL